MRYAVTLVLGLTAAVGLSVPAPASDVQTVADLDAFEDVVDAAWTNNPLSKVMPPCDLPYDNNLGLIGYEDGFDTNFLAALMTETNTSGTNVCVLYPVEVIETTNGSDRVRLYLSALSTNPVAVHTTTVSIANYPEEWIEETYGEAPEWLSGDDLQEWYDDRDPWRQHLFCDLIATSSIPAYLTALTNGTAGGGGGSTNMPALLVLYSNDIAFVWIESVASCIDVYLHAPSNVPTLDLLLSTNLMETYGWTLPATLDHTTDPILWTHAGSEPIAFFASGDPSIDTDGDGLADIREMRIHGTSRYLADSDGDGLTDGEEILTYGLNALSADSDGDGISDTNEVAAGTNPNSSDSDGDGITDYGELYTYFGHVDPMDADSDDDGLNDYAEIITHATYAAPDTSDARDTDGDGLSDYVEVATHSTDPLSVDSDGDGINDGYEVSYEFDPNDDSTVAEDEDGDGFSNLTEYKWCTSPTSSNSYCPDKQRLITRNPGTNAIRHLDTINKQLVVGDLGNQSALVRVRPYRPSTNLAPQRLHHTQAEGIYIDGTEASSMATPIQIAASGSAVEFLLTADEEAAGTNIYFRLTDTNDNAGLSCTARFYVPKMYKVEFSGPDNEDVDVNYGETNTLWLGMPADTNDCRVYMHPYVYSSQSGYGIPTIYHTDLPLVSITGSGADPTTATLNDLDWQSAHGYNYNGAHTRGIKLDYGSYTFNVGCDYNANATLEAAEIQETCEIHVPRLEFQTIKGLYKDDGTYEAGYTSTNDLGRIYCNRVYSPTNPAVLIWSNDTQYIDIEVKFMSENLPVPTNAQIAWYYDDPDDHSDASMHSNSAVVVDPNDYNGSDSDGDGSDVDDDDNTGSRDGASTWEEIDSAYALSGNKTLISNRISKVRFNVTDHGGDNFVIRAKFLRPGSSTPIAGAETGIMTVWKRIHGEYREMVSSNNLPIDDVQDHYDVCFVEWDFQDEGSCTEYEYIEPTPGVDDYCEKWDGVGDGEFRHRGDGGWHFAGSARKFYVGADATPYGSQTNGTATVVDDITLRDASANFTPGDYAGLHLVKINPGQANTFSFTVQNNTATDITIKPFKYTEPDGTLIRSLHLRSSELGLGSNVTYEVREGGVLGIAPDLDANALVFHETVEHVQANRTNAPPLNDMLLRTLVHELMHTFGLEHNCGYADVSGTSSCAGSWSFAPVFYPDGSHEVLPESSDFCGAHIKAIRQSNGYGGQ